METTIAAVVGSQKASSSPCMRLRCSTGVLIAIFCIIISSGTCTSLSVDSVDIKKKVTAATTVQIAGTPKAVPAPDLQAQFEVIPDDGARGWLGADSDVSIVIAGGKTGRRALWIFADTFIATYQKSTNQRIWDGMEMPHSTVALVECTAPSNAAVGQRECPKKPVFHWKTSSSGTAETFWVLPPDQIDGGLQPLLWPVAGLASRDGKTVILLAQRILGGLNVQGTTAIVVDVSAEDPTTWPYTTTPVPSRNGTFNCFSTITWVKPDDPTDASVYLFCHDSTLPQTEHTSTVLARSDFAQLVQHDWSALEYWTASGWTSNYDPEHVKPLNIPSWETTCRWSPELQLFYTFNVNPSLGAAKEISMWTSSEVTGSWKSTVVYQLPPPFSSGGPEENWLCYAAKEHPELAARGTQDAGTAELVFSYICNAFGNTTVEQNQLFQPDGMSLESTVAAPAGIRGYWFRFFRVEVRTMKTAERYVLKTDDISVDADVDLIEYTVSTMELPAGLTKDVVAAIDGRLAAVRERIATFALLTTSLPAAAAPAAAAAIRVKWGSTASPGSYILSERGATAILTVRQNDHVGLLSGIGRLLREVRVRRSSATAWLPRLVEWVHNASAALWPMRGHQVSTAHYPSSLKTWAAFSRYASELAVFGTTQIEVAHIGSPAPNELPMDALVNMSLALNALALNFSAWGLNCNATNIEEALSKIPRIDSLLFESGWDKDRDRLERAKCAKTLRQYHPTAAIWAAAAAHNASLLAEFFQLLEQPELSFVSGLATHMAPVPFPKFVKDAPSRFPIRQYSDLCHTVHAQFPMPNWHYAWALVHVRNPITVLPRRMSEIVRQASNGSSPNIGVGAYSEGLSDDVNKIVFSLLAAEPELSLDTVIRQYARYHFGAEHEEAMTTVLFGLEENWRGDIGRNTAVLHTLRTIQSVESQMTEAELRTNWRFQAFLYRAYFDAHVQARFRFEMQQQERAYAALEQAPILGSIKALAEAQEAFVGTNTVPEVMEWHAKVMKLATTLNETLGASVLQSQAIDLDLHSFGTPFNDKSFIGWEARRIANMTNESTRLASISEVVYWNVPRNGGFFDRLGSVGVLDGMAPHLDIGQGTSDPAFYFTPHHETLAQENWHCSTSSRSASGMVWADSTHSNCNGSGVHTRMDWTSFTLGPSHGAHPITLIYNGLDPAVTYELSILFFSSEFKVRVYLCTRALVLVLPPLFSWSLPISCKVIILRHCVMAWSRHSWRSETRSQQGIQFYKTMLYQCGRCVE
eukprot:SAG31_NODE_822_length_11777_cov_11.328738_6_plen_1264_part_00